MTQRFKKAFSPIELADALWSIHLRRPSVVRCRAAPICPLRVSGLPAAKVLWSCYQTDFLMSELEHDGLKLNRFAAAPSIDSLVSRARTVAERDPKCENNPCKVEMGPRTIRKRKI